MKNYDVVIIGGGPGGYVAAIRCAQLGLNTACIESWIDDNGEPALGGTCLNVGCIPSKALLDSSHHYHHIKNQASEHGINTAGVSIDVNKMISRKKNIIKTLTRGIHSLFKKNKVTWIKGKAKLIDQNKIAISPVNENHDEESTIETKFIIIATGSTPTEIPSLANVDNKLIIDSSGALDLQEIPRRLGIIGAGVIGLELGSVWNRLGSKVTIIEALPDFLSATDKSISTEAEKILRKQGLDLNLNSRVTGTGSNNREVTINYENPEGKSNLVVDKLIVAIGRSPNTQGLGVKECGINIDERGFIVVDDYCKTNINNIYAIGDVVRGPMLAHKASEEGMAVAERISGKPGHINYETIPWVIYTWPEIAWVGKTEQQLKAENIDYKIGSFPFMAIGRARAMDETAGFIKILAKKDTDRILGVHIIGPNASELIAEAVVTMEFDGSAEDLARTIHAHPTLSEAMHEAALDVDGRAIHS